MVNPLNIQLPDDEDDREPGCTDPLCPIHGTGNEEPLPFEQDDAEGYRPDPLQDENGIGGVDNPNASKLLEDMLNQAFGNVGIPATAQVMNGPDAKPFLTCLEAQFVNLTLIQSATAHLFARTGRFEFMEAGRKASELMREAANQIYANEHGEEVAAFSNMVLYDTLKSIGERFSTLAKDMHSGQTSGVFVAPF